MMGEVVSRSWYWSLAVGVPWVDVGLHELYTGGGSGDGLGGGGQDTSLGRGNSCGVDGAEVRSTRLLPGCAVLVMDKAVSKVWDGVLGLPEVLSWFLDAS